MTWRLGGIAIFVLAFTAAPAQAAWPGHNGLIGYDHDTNPGSGASLITISPDGTGQAPLSSPEGIPGDSPAWNPAGTQITFEKDAGMDSEIWIVNADGTGERQLTSGASDSRPAFTADGTRVVFSRFIGPESGAALYIVNADGSGSAQLLLGGNDAFLWEPVISPDGTKLAFTAVVILPSFSIAVWIANSDGSNPQAVTPLEEEFGHQPDFSPDGQTIVFSRCPFIIEGCETQWRIAAVPAVAGGQPITELTSPPVPLDDFSPAFSPDGAFITFYREEQQTFRSAARAAGDGAVRVMNANGSGLRSIGSGPVDRRPDWQPVWPAGDTEGRKSNQKKCRGVPVTIRSTNGNDVIVGTPGRDVVHGLRGRDVIKGLGGKDRLCGGRDTDRIHGGPNDDILFGGHHSDFVFGGSGIDKIFGGTPRAPIHLFIDRCFGGSGRDSFRNCQKRKGLDKKLP